MSNTVKTYAIATDGKSITCLVCGRTSFHPKDVEHKYCANCHKFHGEQLNILACPPVEKAKQLEIGIVSFEPGPDGEKIDCQSCATPVWIGPRQRAARQQFPQALVLCVKCALLATNGGKANVKNLGGIGNNYLTNLPPAKENN